MVYVSHNLMLPKETVGQGIPEKSSDWTCIEKKVRGVPPLGGAPELPGAPLAIKAVAEEACVGVRLLSVDCACTLSNEAMTAKVSETVGSAARMLKVTHSITDPAGTFRRAVVKVVPALFQNIFRQATVAWENRHLQQSGEKRTIDDAGIEGHTSRDNARIAARVGS